MKKAERGRRRKAMQEQKRKSDKVSLIVMIVLIVLLLPVLVVNLTLIVKGSVNPDTPPDIFGVAPLAVTSGSMEGEKAGSFGKGSLIFVKLLDAEGKNGLAEGDVITFKSGDIFVTHRIVSVSRDAKGAAVSLVTQGDANASTDGAIAVGSVVGKCVGSVAGLGGFMLFLLTPAGILLFVGLPILIYVAVDVLLIVLHNRKIAKTQGENSPDENI